MKFTIVMKDPDGVTDSLDAVAREHAQKMVKDSIAILRPEQVQDQIFENLREMIKPFFEYAEYVTIEIDTDTGSARVVKRGEPTFGC